MFPCHFKDRIAAGDRVHTAAIRDYFDPFLNDIRQDCIDNRDKILCIAKSGIFQLLLLHDGHGHFGQVIKHHIIDRSFADLIDRCRLKITPKSLTGCDANFFSHGFLFLNLECFSSVR